MPAQSYSDSSVSNIDRAARARLIDVVRQYLDDEIAAVSFDDELQEIRSSTEDPTVSHVVSSLWFHYDDFSDHHAVLDRHEWRLIQRFLLVLESDATICLEHHRRWSLTQAVAILALVGFTFCLGRFGVSAQSAIMTASCGVVSMLIALWVYCRSPRLTLREMALSPFKSTDQLRAVRRLAPSFVNQPYPIRLRGRRIRAPWVAVLMSVPAFAGWLFIAPLALAIQALPTTDTKVTVHTPSV